MNGLAHEMWSKGYPSPVQCVKRPRADASDLRVKRRLGARMLHATYRADWQNEDCGRSRRRIRSTIAPVGPIRPQSITGRTPIDQPAGLERFAYHPLWLRT